MKQQRPRQAFRHCPPLRERETAQSYLGRLTAYFGAHSPQAFCRDFFLDLRGIQHGEVDAIHDLAALTNSDAGALSKWTPRNLGKLYSELNGETLHTRSNPRRRVSICPSCAAEDIAFNPGMPPDQAVYVRAEWTAGAVDCCINHQVKLISRDIHGVGIQLIDTGYEVANLIELLGQETVPATADSSQLYMLSRIGVIEGTPCTLLDPVQLSTVTRLCHALGTDLLRMRGDGAEAPEVKRAAGYEMFAGGALALEAFVRERRKSLPLGQAAAHRLFKSLLNVLFECRDAKEVDALIDIITDILFRTLPYGDGASLLGRRCRQRTLHDYSSARRAFGLDERQMLAIVTAHPELVAMPADRRHDGLLHAEAFEQYVRDNAPFSSTAATAQMLGFDNAHLRTELKHMTQAGILRAAGDAGRRNHHPIYSIRGVEHDIRAFLERFEKVNPTSPGLRSLPEVTNLCRLPLSALWPLLQCGAITRLGMVPNLPFFRSIRLYPSDVLEAIAGAEVFGVKEACEMLAVHPADIRALMAVGYLNPAALPMEKKRVVFDRREVEAFAFEYVGRFGVRQSFPHNPTVKQLAVQGLAPAIVLKTDQKSGRTVLYRREDVRRLAA